MTGIFAQKHLSGVDASISIQAIGAFVTLFYSMAVSWIILSLIDWTIGLRVDAEHEALGLDLTQHGEQVP